MVVTVKITSGYSKLHVMGCIAIETIIVTFSNILSYLLKSFVKITVGLSNTVESTPSVRFVNFVPQ